MKKKLQKYIKDNLKPKKQSFSCSIAHSIKCIFFEEDDPYIEEFVRCLGIECHGKDVFPSYGEMTPNVLRKSLYDIINSNLYKCYKLNIY